MKYFFFALSYRHIFKEYIYIIYGLGSSKIIFFFKYTFFKETLFFQQRIDIIITRPHRYGRSQHILNVFFIYKFIITWKITLWPAFGPHRIYFITRADALILNWISVKCNDRNIFINFSVWKFSSIHYPSSSVREPNVMFQPCLTQSWPYLLRRHPVNYSKFSDLINSRALALICRDSLKFTQ